MIDEDEVSRPYEDTRYDASLVAQWEAYFRWPTMVDRLREYTDLYPDVASIRIDFDDLNQYSTDLAVLLLDKPEEVLACGRKALKNLAPAYTVGQSFDPEIRIYGLPADTRREVRQIRSKDVGRLISVEALVTRTTAVKSNIRRGYYRCARCGAIIREDMDGRVLKEPLECYRDQGGCGRSAGTTRFILMDAECEAEDSQKIEVQENPERVLGSAQPERIVAWLSREVAGTILPGQKVILNAIPERVYAGERTKTTDREIDLKVVSFEVMDSDLSSGVALSEEDIQEILRESRRPDFRQRVVRSIAPAVKGHVMEKTAMVLQMVGGCGGVLDDGTRMRGTIHLLFAGDPGVAKSLLLQVPRTIIPRASYVSGKGVSTAGLTGAVVTDDFSDGRYTVVAGALPLADGSMVAVDEMDKMEPKDQSALHEAMEQETASVAKAGVQRTLTCRTAILGACNPKAGRFQDGVDLFSQIDIKPTLASRFDAIFIFQDRVDHDKDLELAMHMGNVRMRGQALANRGNPDAEAILERTEELEVVYSPDFLRKYFAYAKRMTPILTPEAVRLCSEAYAKVRQSGFGGGDSQGVPVTARQFQGYARFAEASAKLRLSDRVEEEDARTGIEIINYAYHQLINVHGVLDLEKLETGTSRNERQKMTVLFDLIRQAGADGIRYDILMSEATVKGLTEREADQILQNLKNKGEVYEPRQGTYAMAL